MAGIRFFAWRFARRVRPAPPPSVEEIRRSEVTEAVFRVGSLDTCFISNWRF